jgi:hypothetical protein
VAVNHGPAGRDHGFQSHGVGVRIPTCSVVVAASDPEGGIAGMVGDGGCVFGTLPV